MAVRGRKLSAGDIGQIHGLRTEHLGVGRTRLSEELCRRRDWRNAPGLFFKDMTARTLPLNFERAGPHPAAAAVSPQVHQRGPQPQPAPGRSSTRTQACLGLIDRIRQTPEWKIYHRR